MEVGRSLDVVVLRALGIPPWLGRLFGIYLLSRRLRLLDNEVKWKEDYGWALIWCSVDRLVFYRLVVQLV